MHEDLTCIRRIPRLVGILSGTCPLKPEFSLLSLISKARIADLRTRPAPSFSTNQIRFPPFRPDPAGPRFPLSFRPIVPHPVEDISLDP